MVHEFKKLLHLTDFQDRHNLDKVSDLEQLFNLLDSYQLPRCRAFLVIDNISHESWEALRMFLPLGLGPGSKVILAARTFQILQPAFLLLEQYGQHYIWNDMQIPSIQEMEAIQILLQTSGHAVQHINLPPTQRETIVRIVRMCNFGSEYYPQYLPLVMKMMGAMLIAYDGNLVRWGSDLRTFWGKVKTYKEKAVKELVEKSFQALPDEKLQLLFFDLSLFILPLNLKSLEEVYVLLSTIYDGCSVADIELMIKDLERHCFLTTLGCTFKVHDMYLEFAKSISEDPSRFKSSIRYYWRNDKYTGAKDEKVFSLKEVDQGTGVEHQQVRAMILEVQGDGYKRVELQGFSNLKALAVRNCKALTVLGLVGLSSLASLDILNCPNLRHVDGSNSCNVKRLRIYCPEGHGQAGDKGGKTFLGWLVDSFFFKQSQSPQRSSLEMGIATKFRGLQDLRLENTGIRRLINMSSCWPQLQNLTVKECFLEAFEVGNFPNLKCFYFQDHKSDLSWNSYPEWDMDEYRTTQTWESKKDNPRFMLQGKGLLEGCPQLEEVEIQSAFFEKGELGTALPPNMVSFRLGFLNPTRILPDLSPAAHTLEHVDLQWCEKLEKISFLVEFGKLTRLVVVNCHSLVELTGLGFLCSLRLLHVVECSNLRAILGPFDNLKMLEIFLVSECPKLPGLPGADLENLVSIEVLVFPLKRAAESRHGHFNLKNLQKLKHLKVKWGQIIEDESECSTSTMLEGLENLVNLKQLLLHGRPISSNDEHERRKAAVVSMSFSSLVAAAGLVQRPSTSHLSSTTTTGKCQLNIEYLKLKRLSELASMDGLEQLYLPNLWQLKLHNLENLRSLRGLESLVHLQSLLLLSCPMLEELPSLHTLVNLSDISILHCAKLKAVQGANAIVKSGSLRYARFEGCKSLVHLPISVDGLREYEERKSDRFDLEFKECRFASREAMMAWAVNADMPWSLRRPCCQELLRIVDSSLREALFDGMFPLVLNMLRNYNENDCVNFKNREVQEKVGGVAKKDLLQKFQAHPQCELRFLDELVSFLYVGVVSHTFEKQLEYAYYKIFDDSKEGSEDESL